LQNQKARSWIRWTRVPKLVTSKKEG